MGLFEKRDEHHAGDKTSDMCHIGNIAADLPHIGELQNYPAAKHQKCWHIHHPEKYQNTDNAPNIGAWVQYEICP
ncbi:MAG: Uncharacterised protein [Rhodobiaceae bacterium UBA7378]|nr:MAG: Uncharacterised protein [Rhodobiaceae bacterium UBA7378]